ncbi:MAG: hypothetical protein JXR51_09925 [Bacteroidales bacterium]|nr:hypothetical protein [Bacteroidales bacterium]MBN2757483.1 hypothetical protein [Bacteroidales bacterium]
MKKLILILMVICTLLAFYPIQSNATTKVTPSTLVADKPAESARAKVLLLRLDEIKAMDKTNLKSPEKRVLRKEVRSIKKELQTMGHGIYVSLGAIIIIVLLLVILF